MLTSAPRRPGDVDHEAIIVGSGFSGIGAAVALSRIGIDDFLILEREREPGGTWVQHDYPGLEVDMPFFIYSFPFEMKPDWSRVYPSADELRTYTRGCAEKYGLGSRTRCGAPVARAEWSDEAARWTLTLEDGETLRARFLVNATGLLVKPKLPEIPGLASFGGATLHTARWDPNVALAGRRVGVIGTGATSIQIVPAIADEAASLEVFQRTPIWLCPKPNPALSPRFQHALGTFPGLQVLLRWLTNLFVEIAMGMGFVRYTRFPFIFDWIERRLAERIRDQVDDPATQEALTPDYSFFCKRPSFSDRFYPAFNREHVSLVTAPIEAVTPAGIRTGDDVEHPLDVIVCATGYHVFDRTCMPGYEIVGRDGRDLGRFWEAQRFQAYEGATVPGFPNLFLFMGPYSAAGASYFTMIDTQSKHMTRCIREARRRRAATVEVRLAAHERDFEKVKRRRVTTVLFGGNCAPSNSYYFDARGDTPGLRPVTGFEHWWNSRSFPMSAYRFD